MCCRKRIELVAQQVDAWAVTPTADGVLCKAILFTAKTIAVGNVFVNVLIVFTHELVTGDGHLRANGQVAIVVYQAIEVGNIIFSFFLKGIKRRQAGCRPVASGHIMVAKEDPVVHKVANHMKQVITEIATGTALTHQWLTGGSGRLGKECRVGKGLTIVGKSLFCMVVTKRSVVGIDVSQHGMVDGC